MQVTSKGSDQTARMRRQIWGFAGRTYHIVGNLMSRLNYFASGGSEHGINDWTLDTQYHDVVQLLPEENESGEW